MNAKMSDKRHNNKKNCFMDTTIKEARKRNGHTLKWSELKPKQANNFNRPNRHKGTRICTMPLIMLVIAVHNFKLILNDTLAPTHTRSYIYLCLTINGHMQNMEA